MRHGLAAALVGIALMAPLSGAAAQQEKSGCAAGSPTLPPELAAWSSRRPVAAAGNASELSAAALGPGIAVDATLRSTSEIRYVRQPEKPGGSVSYGGLFRFTVEQAGTYRVALGSGAWIDVLKGGKTVTSTAHGHGPDCSGIRKMVDFPLEPGRYTLQIAANGAPTLPLLIARLP
jgi:hypothetical protein